LCFIAKRKEEEKQEKQEARLWLPRPRTANKMKYAPDGKETALTDSKRVSSCPARCSMSQG
jgi:hypothetical protein